MPDTPSRSSDTALSTPAVRAAAARALNCIYTDNRTIDWVEQNRPEWVPTPTARALVYEVLRYSDFLTEALYPQLTKPLKRSQKEVEALLLVGTYLLLIAKEKPHAAIFETVEAVKVLKKKWAVGLVNAILRSLTKSTDQTIGWVESEPSYGLVSGSQILETNELLSVVAEQYPDTWTELANAFLTRAPMTLRVNRNKITRDAFTEALQRADIAHTCNVDFVEAVTLVSPQPAETVPGFEEGWFAVQDLGAQMAAYLLLKPAIDGPIRLLDACAAPGGKAMHCLERAETLDLEISELAIDSSPARIESTRTIAERLGHQINLTVADASTEAWWDGHPFTHILLDAPCSGSGTVRRHPDIPILFSRTDLLAHSALQLELVNNLWRTLAPGGTLLYCTCSIFAQENDQVVSNFVSNQTDAIVTPIALPRGQKTDYGWQLLPTDTQTDGFYYALLAKTDTKTDAKAES